MIIQPSISSGVLITGSNGFVGTHLSTMLADRGWSVLAVSREPCGKASTARTRRVCLPLSGDPEGWQDALTSVQSVIHLAARVHQVDTTDVRSAALFREVNVDGSRFVAEQAARAGVRRFIFLSSVKVNGEITEGRPYRADDLPKPQDPYANSKLQAELVLRDVCVQRNMELVIIRSPLVYGPGVRANFRRLMQLADLGLPLPFRAIDNRRSLISVWNLSDFIETCLKHQDAAGRAWLISDGEDISTPSLILRLATEMQKRLRLFSVRPNRLKFIAKVFGLGREMSRLCDSLQVDVSPAMKQLLWRAPVSMDEGLARTVASYRSAPRQ